VPGGPDWVGGLAADVTPAAVADLSAEPGAELWFVVKATEVAVHAASS
jgi:molybdate transport system ATP-binding protein